MKKLFTCVLLLAMCLAAQGQKPNEQLRQLEDYLRQQGYVVTHTQSNSQGKGIRHTFRERGSETACAQSARQHLCSADEEIGSGH